MTENPAYINLKAIVYLFSAGAAFLVQPYFITLNSWVQLYGSFSKLLQYMEGEDKYSLLMYGIKVESFTKFSFEWNSPFTHGSDFNIYTDNYR